MQEMNFYYNGLICGSVITQEMQKEVGANPSHIEGFTDFFRSINKVEIAYCIIEQTNNNHTARGGWTVDIDDE